MSKFSLDKEMEMEVKATFIAKGLDAPVSGDEYRLRLYNKALFGEDFLGESKLSEAGEGRIIFANNAFSNTFKSDEFPDFYFVLYKTSIPVFQSQVIEGLNREVLETYKPGEGEVIDLGTYLVDDQESA